MTLTEFLSDRLRRLILQAVFVMAGTAFLHATGTQAGILLLLLLVWFFALIGTQAVDFLKCRSRLSELESIMDGLDEKYLFAECIPTPQNAYERRLLFLFKRAGRSMIGAVSDAQAANREYRAYVESWVHEIKTPITAAELICRRADKESGQKLSVELTQIKAHVERALFYARAESPEKDFLIRQISLSQLVDNAIDNHRSLLIQSGLRIETENLEQTVYTDEKWTVFILGQLLQNAARYRNEHPLITFSASQLGEQVQLTVSDNGIGIPAHELPRVFERGFTGSNGRSRGGSTGMGLYLCRRLAAHLELLIQISSEVEKGTQVTLTFPSRSNLTKS
ncbi:MAG: HAMP domain-containing histidine kinase [Lachnospiraceae bacterium]|nr:HAMP domain-containing histidine kinase [Lachnospiraceae bacterium]